MARATLLTCLVGLLAGPAWADRLVLVDGRSFTGTVMVEEETVLVVLPYGSLRFPKDKVARIERRDTPQVELAKKLAATKDDDTRGLFEIAQWAATNNLGKQADKIFAQVIALDANHPGARRCLGYVRIDSRWREFAKAMELARSKLEAAPATPLLNGILADMELVARHRAKAQVPVIRELRGRTQIRIGRFAAAEKTFQNLADKGAPPASIRYAAIAGILKTHPDGMYVLVEPYPPSAGLLGQDEPTLEAGPTSLRHPLALAAALHGIAKGHIDAGKKLMKQAHALDATDPDAARSKYIAAGRAFDKADAIVPGPPPISRSYRIEIVRRKIASLRKSCAAGARKFDKEMDTLGRKTMSPAAYRNKIERLRWLLNKVRAKLKDIKKIAEPYSQELILEVKWAEFDLNKMDQMRRVLIEELNGKK